MGYTKINIDTEKKSVRKISEELNYTTHVVYTNLKDYNFNRVDYNGNKILNIK